MPIYVIQVITGYEQRISDFIEKNVSSCYVNECFVPSSERPYRSNGVWTHVVRPMFPGYVFVDTDNIEGLNEQLHELPEFARILEVSGIFTPLSEDEVAWLQALTSRNDRTLGMSQGIIKDGELFILSGPLMGHTASIRRIDRHKRLAYVEVDMLGRKNTVKLGLEITEKTP